MSKSIITLICIGSDPEMFLFKGGAPISSVGLIPGSKRNPHKITEDESVQVDNVAIEFNIKPSTTPEEFIESLNTCYNWAASHLCQIDPAIELMPIASTRFPASELRSRQARDFGCEPDFNAWEEGEMNPSPERDGNLRSCGGHIHLGFQASGFVDVNRLVRLLDKHVGTYCAEVCGDDLRRSLYGKAGSYRIKTYGVEYRTPSVRWLTSEESIREVFARVKHAVEAYNNEEDATIATRILINEGQLQFTLTQ